MLKGKNFSLWVVALFAGIFIFSAISPLSWIDEIPLCLFRLITKFECPGCGLTRAFVSFFHGDFIQSIRFNAMAPVIILWFFIYLVESCHVLAKGFRPSWFTAAGNRWISRSFMLLLLTEWAFKTGSHLSLLLAK